MQAKKIPNGYTGGWTWAVVVESPYGYEVVESGFRTKRDAVNWMNK